MDPEALITMNSALYIRAYLKHWKRRGDNRLALIFSMIKIRLRYNRHKKTSLPNTGKACLHLYSMVGEGGVEPPWVAPEDFKKSDIVIYVFIKPHILLLYARILVSKLPYLLLIIVDFALLQTKHDQKHDQTLKCFTERKSFLLSISPTLLLSQLCSIRATLFRLI